MKNKFYYFLLYLVFISMQMSAQDSLCIIEKNIVKKYALKDIDSISFAGSEKYSYNGYVMQKNGLSYPLNSNKVKKITFYGSNMIVNQKDGVITSFSIFDIQKIYFDKKMNMESIDTCLGNDFSFKLSPNPVHDLLNITFTLNSMEPILIYVYLADSRLVYSKTIIPNNVSTFKLDVSDWIKGIYILKMNNGRCFVTRKFIKN